MIILRIILVYHLSFLEIKVPVNNHQFRGAVLVGKEKRKRYFTMSSTPNSTLHFSQSSIISLDLVKSNLRARKNLLKKWPQNKVGPCPIEEKDRIKIRGR